MAKFLASSSSPPDYVDDAFENDDDEETQEDYRSFQEWLNGNVDSPPTAPAETAVASAEPVGVEAPSGSSGSTGTTVHTPQSEAAPPSNPYLGPVDIDPASKCALCQKTTENCYSICSSVLFFCSVLYSFLRTFNNNILSVPPIQ